MERNSECVNSHPNAITPAWMGDSSLASAKVCIGVLQPGKGIDKESHRM